MLTLEKSRPREDLLTSKKKVVVECSKFLFPGTSDRIRRNGLRLWQRRSRLDIRKDFFTEMVESTVKFVRAWWKEVWERILSEGEAVVSNHSIRIVPRGSIFKILLMGNSARCFN